MSAGEGLRQQIADAIHAKALGITGGLLAEPGECDCADYADAVMPILDRELAARDARIETLLEQNEAQAISISALLADTERTP
jgi:hypothetical protein